MIVADYECVKCNASGNGPQTIVPLQSVAPKCPRCGEWMTEATDS